MIILDYRDSRPIYEQVVDKLSDLMVRGVLEEGAQLPSVRSLAMELSINPNTIQRAYAELERRGCIYSVKGRGNFVADPGIIREKKKYELLDRFSALAREAAALGVGADEICSAVRMGCRANDNGDKEGSES